MKKTIYVLILSLAVVSGLVFSFAPFAYGSGANHEIKNGTNASSKQLTVTEREAEWKKWNASPERKAHLEAERKKWEASPDGIRMKKWHASPAGKKMHASHDKIRKFVKAFDNMEAVVTSTTFRRDGKSSAIKWLIVKIDGEHYMMQFIPKDFEPLKSLKVNDKIVVRSRSAGYSPNHPYLIVSGDYIEHDGKILFKRDFSKNKGC